MAAGGQGCDYLVELVRGEDLDQAGAGEGSEAVWELLAAQKFWIWRSLGKGAFADGLLASSRESRRSARRAEVRELEGHACRQQLDGGGESFSCGKVVDVDGGLFVVSIEGMIHSSCFETRVDEGGCGLSTAGAKFDGDRSRVKGGKIANLLTLCLKRY